VFEDDCSGINTWCTVHRGGGVDCGERWGGGDDLRVNRHEQLTVLMHAEMKSGVKLLGKTCEQMGGTVPDGYMHM
jgi:hypothetical protein